MERDQKRVLFLSAKFFDYQNEIKKCMEQEGYVVDYFDERPANSFLIKALIRLNPKLIRKYIDKYHKKIIEQTVNNRYDFVFIIKAEAISSDSLQKLKALHKEAKFVLYMWDNFDNFADGPTKIKFFDRVLTFDKDDAIKYNLQFRPLFYIPQYRQVATNSSVPNIDVLFVGTIHSDRYIFLEQIKTQVEQLSKKCYFYMFFMSNILYYKMKMENKSLKKVKKANFQFKALNQEQIIDLFSHSKAIIDIQHPKQTGLTMRTIETLGAERKLITTNKTIIDYDFYNPANIIIVDRVNPIINKNFLTTDYIKTDSNTLKRYSLRYWVNEVLS